MENNITFKELLDCINVGLEDSKANCTIGLFVSDHYKDKVVESNNFIVKKPIVSISSFAEQNEWFYVINFHFKSFNDADYKQMWRFLCDFARKAKQETERLLDETQPEKLAALSINIIPDKYRGKYFAYINMPLEQTITTEENAYDNTAVISLVCEANNFGVLFADDDVIDPRSIEREVEQEVAAEL